MIREEKKSDNKKILLLEENVLGPGRYARPSFRLREGLKPNTKYSKVYFKGNKIIQVFRSMIYKINNIQIMIWKPRSNQKVKVNKAKIVI